MFVVLFVTLWCVMFFGTFAAIGVGIAAAVSVAKLPAEAFGPWWDNTKTPWLLGIAISYLVPFGTLITGVYWFRTGKRGLRETGVAARPFWVGPPKPPPMYPPYQPYPPGPPPEA